MQCLNVKILVIHSLSHKDPAGHLGMEYTACRCHSITLMKSKIMIWS